MITRGGPAASASELIAGEWWLEFAWNQTKSLAPTQDYVPRTLEITPANSEQQFVQSISDFFFFKSHLGFVVFLSYEALRVPLTVQGISHSWVWSY